MCLCFVPPFLAQIAARDDLQRLKYAAPGAVLSRQLQCPLAVAASRLEVAEVDVNLGQIEVTGDDTLVPSIRFRELDRLSGGGDRLAVLVLKEVEVRDQELTSESHHAAGELSAHRHRVVKGLHSGRDLVVLPLRNAEGEQCQDDCVRTSYGASLGDRLFAKRRGVAV